jgi:hypothetical protein
MPAWPFVFYCLTAKIGTLREWPLLAVLLKKSYLADEPNFLGPLMRLAFGEVRTTSFHTKTTTELRIGATGFAATETSKDQISRDFRCRSSFDFFNNIGAKRTSDKPRAIRGR